MRRSKRCGSSSLRGGPSAVHVSALGYRILVQDDDAVWEPNSGQLQIDFDVADVAAEADFTGVPRRIAPAHRGLEARSSQEGMSADDWFNTGLDLEAVADHEAIVAHQKALTLEVDHADAHLNLGRLLHESGQVEKAESHYRSATVSDAESARGS